MKGNCIQCHASQPVRGTNLCMGCLFPDTSHWYKDGDDIKRWQSANGWSPFGNVEVR